MRRRATPTASRDLGLDPEVQQSWVFHQKPSVKQRALRSPSGGRPHHRIDMPLPIARFKERTAIPLRPITDTTRTKEDLSSQARVCAWHRTRYRRGQNHRSLAPGAFAKSRNKHVCRPDFCVWAPGAIKELEEVPSRPPFSAHGVARGFANKTGTISTSSMPPAVEGYRKCILKHVKFLKGIPSS